LTYLISLKDQQQIESLLEQKNSIFSINKNAICLVAIVNKSNLLLAENEFFEVNFEAIILYAPANNFQLHLQKFQ
jgi:hypothetical protein